MLRKILITFIVFVGLLGALFGVLYYSFSSGKLQEVAVDNVLNKVIKNAPDATVSTAQETNFIKKLLGFDRTQTYLILLLNNTELRPGGGFIGSYATVQITKGVPSILKVEGTEILDYSGYPTNFPSVPPAPISTFLKVDRWYFRDSNWSPDFTVSAAKSLELYKKEQGVAASEVTTVVGITTAVLEELLKKTGPIMVNGEEFTAANVVEKLQYEVEFGFQNKGVTVDQRKQVLSDLVKAMMRKLATDVFVHWSDYFSLAERMFEEKQVVMYSTIAEDQAIISAKGWGGGMKFGSLENDFLFWVDANLGALKTDAVMKRQLYYTITPSAGSYIATVVMKYTHQGKTDWRTSRYLTYARLFVPQGSELLQTRGLVKNAQGVEGAPADQGEENGRAWFGGFTTVEPLNTREVVMQFRLAPSIAERIKKGTYELTVQKQIGTIDTALTLSLDFGKTIARSQPENQSSDLTKFLFTNTLLADKQFTATFK